MEAGQVALERGVSKQSTRPIPKIVRDRIKDRLKGLRAEGRLTADLPRQTDRACELFGYSVDDLVTHLERQFDGEMDWRRFASAEIHIDHVQPLKAFDLSDPCAVAAAFALANLRPLWAADNIAKGAT